MNKSDLQTQVILAARQYGISELLFRNAAADQVGVNVTDMQCLGLLFHKGIATPKELSRYTGLSSGSTTAMLDRLEQARLIERRPNPDDKRGALIAVRKDAAPKFGPLFAGVRTAQNELVGGYSKEQLQTLLDFFSRFTDIYESEHDKLRSA